MSRVSVLSIAAVAAAAALTGAAFAEPVRPQQDPTPAHQYPAAASLDALDVQAVHNFGACVVENTPQGAREALALDYRTEDYQKKLRAVADGHRERCLLNWSRLKTNPSLLAGAMAEALLKSDVKRAELPDRLAFNENRVDLQARSPLEEMALCTVLYAPKQTVALFETEPGTPDEARAFQPLTDPLENCVKKDVKVELNGPGLRSLLALAAWRIANAPMKAAP